MGVANDMVAVGECPGHVTGLPLRGLVSDGLLSPRLEQMQTCFDRLASRSAREQGIPQALQANPGLFALWGRMGGGEVLGLHRVGGVWLMTQVPVPTRFVHRLNLPSVLEARDKLAWVLIELDRIHLIRNGERVPSWPVDAPDSLQSALQAPHVPKPPSVFLT